MFAALTVATITVLLLYLLKMFKTCTDFSEVITAVQQNAHYIGLGLVRFQDCYFRFGSVRFLALKLGFVFFGFGIAHHQKPPDVESASPSVGLI